MQAKSEGRCAVKQASAGALECRPGARVDALSNAWARSEGKCRPVQAHSNASQCRCSSKCRCTQMHARSRVTKEWLSIYRIQRRGRSYLRD